MQKAILAAAIQLHAPDRRLAEAPENRHQQDGGKQQDQHICVQIFPPFLST
ncbi:hypothetical protein [Aeromonas salmonicida]|uniref:hypothetical protein n=1 Tax=Aeromonas salmonicida TaxID=645 RepID=UPI0038BC51FC